MAAIQDLVIGEAEDVDEENDDVERNVDTGWAWVIVAAAFCINFIHMGMYRSYGFLFVELLKEFKASTSLTSLVVGIYSGANSLTAFITLNVLVNRFSIRVICVCGGFLMTLGGVLSYFAMNLEFLIFAQSCLSGIGAALLTGPCIVIVGEYFDRRPALAQGISSCGTSLGSMAVPQLTRYLFSMWGVRTTLLISGGIEAAIILFALFFKPVSKKKTISKHIPLVKGSSIRLRDELNTKTEPAFDEACAMDKSSSLGKLSADRIHKELMSTDEDAKRKNSANEDTISFKEQNGSFKVTYEPIVTSEDHGRRCSDISYKEHADIYQLDMMDSDCNPTSELMSASAENDNDIIINKTSSKEISATSRSCRCKPSFVDCTIFLLPHFYLIIGQHIFGSVVALFSAFLPATAEDVGLSSLQAATLLTIFAGVDCGSRFLSGVIVQTGKIKSHHLLAISLVVEGILFHCTRFYTSSVSMIVYAGLFGLFCGAIPAMDPVVMTDFLGQLYLPNSLGISMLIHGAVLAGITPILGALKDYTGSFHASYHLMGTCSILSGIFLLCEPLAKKVRLRHTHEDHSIQQSG